MTTKQTTVRLGFRRMPGESMRDTVKRYAQPWGLEFEALSYFDSDLASGATDIEAAMYALGEWDLLEILGDADDFE